MVIGCALAGCRPDESRSDREGAQVSPFRPGRPTIRYPLDETVFPPEIAAPKVVWDDPADADSWTVRVDFADGTGSIRATCDRREWTPSDEQWEAIKRWSIDRTEVPKGEISPFRAPACLSVTRGAHGPGDTIRFATSADKVGAPLFYREVILPFFDAFKRQHEIRWRFGEISAKAPPQIVLSGLPVCGNCHSFSADGKLLGMDVDYANDKGSYAIVPVREQIELTRDRIISWSDWGPRTPHVALGDAFRPRDQGSPETRNAASGDREPTYGLLSQVSPDGRYVVSTVKDRSVFVPRPGLMFSQLFFPIKGVLAVYDRRTGTFSELPGANDRRFVQSNPAWRPDGKEIAFIRAEAYELKGVPASRDGGTGGTAKAILTEEEGREFVEGHKTFRFDIYRIPFNAGRGGQAEPLAGASANGKSNFFPKYSPDGRWIVFCQADSFALLQPDSELHIVPSTGGAARRLRCNTGRMNSWHTFSPNGRWLAFSSKANGPYTQLFIAHINARGESSPAVLLARMTAPDRAANIPEFVNAPPGAIRGIVERFMSDADHAADAEQQLTSGRHEAAERAARRALRLNRNNAAAHSSLGAALAGLGRTDEARQSFRSAARLDPHSAEPHIGLGLLALRCDALAEACDCFTRAIELAPHNADAYNQLGVAMERMGNVPEAMSAYRKAVRVGPRNVRACFNLGVLLAVQTPEGRPDAAGGMEGEPAERQRDQARACFVQAVQLDSSLSSVHRNLGTALPGLGDLADAAEHCQAPEALDLLAGAYAEVGRFDDARRQFERALRLAQAADKRELADAIRERITLLPRPSAASRPDPGPNRQPVERSAPRTTQESAD